MLFYLCLNLWTKLLIYPTCLFSGQLHRRKVVELALPGFDFHDGLEIIEVYARTLCIFLLFSFFHFYPSY